MSKGSRQRPTNKLTFNSNYDKIFKVRKQTPSHGSTKPHLNKKKEAKKRGNLYD